MPAFAVKGKLAEMGSEGSRPTLADVARLAGVSPTSASRAITGSGPVSDETREKVEAAVAALGYKPRRAAQRTPRRAASAPAATGNIAVLVPSIRSSFFSVIVQGIHDEAREDGMLLTVISTTEEPQRQRRALQTLEQMPASGAVVCGTSLPAGELIAYHERSGTPLALVSRRVSYPAIPCILVDSENATYRIAQHLLSLHHTRIGFLEGPSHWEFVVPRRRGLELALAEAGLTLSPEWRPASLGTVEGGFQAMSALLALPEDRRPTAVIAYNDTMALGALQAARVHGLGVPEDISVVGFDDIDTAAHANPPLTTVAQPMYRMGRLAVQMLRQMRNENLALGGYTLLESALIVRRSTGQAPGSWTPDSRGPSAAHGPTP